MTRLYLRDSPPTFPVKILYVKRLIGLPGETVGIHGGRLYATDARNYPAEVGIAPEELRLPAHLHKDDEEAVKQLRADLSGSGPRKFAILHGCNPCEIL